MSRRTLGTDQSFGRRKERRKMAMRLRESAATSSADENDSFNRSEVNRKRSGRPISREEEAKFLLKYAKRKLDDEKYDKLTDLIMAFQFRSINTTNLLSLVENLLEGDKLLFSGLEYFFHKRYKMNLSLEVQGNENPIALLVVKDEVEKLGVEMKKQNVGLRNKFFEALNPRRPNMEILRKLGVIFKNKDYLFKDLDYFSKNFTTYLERHEGSRETLPKYQKSFHHHSSHSGNKAKKLHGVSQLMKKGGGSKSIPISQSSAQPSSSKGNDDEGSNDVLELDLSTYPRISPKYVLLPKNDLTKIEGPQAELNDQCKSVSRRRFFKRRQHSKYAKKLFEYEDIRFELDVLIGSTKSAIEHVENRLKRLEEEQTSDKDSMLEKDLTLIESLYGEHGLLRENEIFAEKDDLRLIETFNCELRKDETKALLVIMKILRQKKKYFEEHRSDFNVLWTQVIGENHRKAL